MQRLASSKTKVLLAGHPYNLYDALIGEIVTNYLTENNIEIIYSDLINKKIITSECEKLSKNNHQTYNKSLLASINYYQDKVDGIIFISSFPCEIDSLNNELLSHKIKNTPKLSLIFKDINNESKVIKELDHFINNLTSIKERKIWKK